MMRALVLIWIVIYWAIAISAAGLVVYVAVNAASDPSSIGRFAGKIVAGFQDEINNGKEDRLIYKRP